jgi:methyltransferase (TIGR00027 family)
VVDPPAEAFSPVSATAVGVAAIRAAESGRPDRLFADPLAAAFVRAAGWTWRQPTTGEDRRRISALATWVAIRTRFLDDLVLDACKQDCRQVVILGAGLDARAFRIRWPRGVRLFELDLNDVLAFKQRVVSAEGGAATCERIVVPADLTQDWTRALLQAGFNDARPVVWLAEGLLAYLTPDQNDALVDDVTSLSMIGSRLGLTLASGERQPQSPHPQEPTGVGTYRALWRSASPGEPSTWLGSRGWDVQAFDAHERAVILGRAQTSTTEPRTQARLIDATRR